MPARCCGRAKKYLLQNRKSIWTKLFLYSCSDNLLSCYFSRCLFACHYLATANLFKCRFLFLFFCSSFIVAETWTLMTYLFMEHSLYILTLSDFCMTGCLLEFHELMRICWQPKNNASNYHEIWISPESCSATTEWYITITNLPSSKTNILAIFMLFNIE